MYRYALSIAVLFIASESLAQTYLPGAAPTAAISHNTTETVPGPTTRLTVGIKESVACAISNWNDPDIRVDGSVQTPVSDNYGTIGWAASNGGSCVPTTGPTTTYTACESATATTETVTMTAEDASTANGSPLGNDVAAITVTLSFTVLVPTTHELPALILANPGYPPAGTARVGAYTHFKPQHGPLTVSFKNVTFRENYPDAVQVWPDGTNLTRAGATPGYSVAPHNGQPNFWATWDNRATGCFPKARLLKPGDVAPNYTASETVFSVPLEFQANGTFHQFTDPPAFFKFYSNLTAKSSFDTTYGTVQGPWQ